MANRLTKIYTRTGDKGKTGLADGSRVDKFNERIESLGNIDELNSIIGIILIENLPADKKTILEKIQHDLFDIGGELSIPNHMVIDEVKINFLENSLDEMNNDLPSLKEFILPGGCKASSFCHLARTVCRRVERNLFKLTQTEKVNESSLKYINRLSDFLFVLARFLNKTNEFSDVFWKKE
ncbi:cob(I)yrinic acid a,c-diamide adenosyltransferase [Methylophilaceae bacterium]|nr:cob(I)yrinic acid a,c-diamide adenosyltransferase [Methylophilaceae bacterium]|tara:strand:+ start:4460 stop:5002 length:543 start_codon:yes stop_codon:yes gene_type:complete